MKNNSNGNSNHSLADPVALYRTLLRRTPNSPQVQLIRTTVKRTECARAHSRSVLSEWAGRGYNPANHPPCGALGGCA